MDTQLFSTLLGGIAPSAAESPRWYSSWSTCEDEDHVSAVALQGGTEERVQDNLSSSGSCPDMFGLVTSILEEPNKQESVTDWNSLSRLFPPVCSSDLENVSNNFSGPFSKKNLGKKGLTTLADAQDPYEENFQNLCVESSEKEVDNLYLIGSWPASPDPSTQSPDEILKNTNTKNRSFKSNEVNHLHRLASQKVNDHDKEQLNTECGKSHADSSVFSSQAKIKDSTNTYAGYQKTDKARYLLRKSDKEGPTKYFTQFSNPFAGGIWDPGIQENLSPKRYTAVAASCDRQQFSGPPLYFLSPTFNKENSSPQETNTKLLETCPQNSYRNIGAESNLGSHECQVPAHPQKGSGNHLPLKPALQNMNSSYNGYTWLDNKTINPVVTPSVSRESQKQMGPPLFSEPSTQLNEFSVGRSVAQTSYSQMPPVSSSRNGGKLQITTHTNNNNNNNSGILSSTENWRPHLIGPAQNPSLGAEEMHSGRVSNASWNWSSQKRSVNESTKHHPFHNKQSQYSTNERTMLNDKRCSNSWNPQAGYIGQNCSQLNILGRRQEQNGSSLSDFINPFLPLFPLVHGYKQTPAFPPYNPHSFSSPATVAFSPLPFPLSELVDVFRYDDFHHWSPLINDLLCGDIAAPYFAFPLPFNNYRPPKNRSGPANELHVRLEECYGQWRALEWERKKTEADLARNFPGKQVAISNSTPFSRLPAKPSRVDRLIVDQFREQARVRTLTAKMEKLSGIPIHHNISATIKQHLEAIYATQARRKDEIVNSANSPRQGPSRYNSEKDVLALAVAIKNLAFSTRKTRTALWCALQMILPKTWARNPVKKEDIERTLQELCPLQGSSPAKYEEPQQEPQQVVK